MSTRPMAAAPPESDGDREALELTFRAWRGAADAARLGGDRPG